MEVKPLLEMVRISKSFSGVKVLHDVSLSVYGGEVMALLGENGAGKSTLMKILSGLYKCDSGEIYLDGHKVQIDSVKDAQKLGISFIHQELSVLPNLTVWENIFLGHEVTSGYTKKIDKAFMREKSRELLKSLGCTFDVNAKAGDLTIGEMQMIEIIKAVSANSRIVIMDEPTASLTDYETKKLFEVIAALKSKGMAVIYISHRLDEIFEVCSRVTVLRDGKLIGVTELGKVDKNQLISMMVGRNLEEQYPHIVSSPGKVMLLVEKLNYKNKVKNVSFSLREGEIVGMAGLVGAGRSETAKVILGEYKKTSGDIFVNGKKVDIKSSKDAIKNGIVYLSEDRKKEGLILNWSVGENMTLPSLKKYVGNFRRIVKKKEVIDFKEYAKKMSIKTTGYSQIASNLSGGNQQKVIIAKWLMMKPQILIFDEPTRGIDVGAKKEIYEILNELKKNNKAILVISSDMQEILGISDRIVVMNEGEVAGEIDRRDASQEAIMKYAVGISNRG